jgi:hypothetical protein
MPPAPRRAVERRTGPLLVVLSRQPKLLVPLVAAGLLLVSLFLPGRLAAVPLVLLLLLVGWLTYLSWPVLDGAARTLRLVVLGMVLLLTVRAF